MSGVETADFLGEHNRDVTVMEMRPDVALDEQATVRYFLMQRLEEHKTKFVTGAKITEFFDDGVAYEQDGKACELRGFKTIVLAMGGVPYNPLEAVAKKLVKEVYIVGDADKTGPANLATESGLAAALAL